MTNTIRRIFNCIIVCLLVGAVTLTAQATTISDVQDQLNQHQNEYSSITGEIDELSDEQDLLEEEISDLDAELINMMSSISILEEDIATKEADIAMAQSEYEKAKAQEESQYEAMTIRIQMMYENGSTGFLEGLLEAGNLSDMLNRAIYIEDVYEYDRNQLTAYQETKKQVQDLWATLEEEKQGLEAQKADMEEQQAYLDTLLAKKKAESDNFAAMIARAKQEASVVAAKIKQEKALIKTLEEEERRKAQAAANANGTYNVAANYASLIDNATGSDLGKQIARYGCQYVGNPYVSGGTSLTSGADCSGFTYRIYSDFGYSIPRTSYLQRSAGTSVSYENAQPGDLICYDGHVALYIGGGYIVHASSAKTGIKISKATYRSIISVRRII